MVDWLTVTLPYSGEVWANRGLIASFTRGGEVEWSRPRALEVEGSYSSKIHAIVQPGYIHWYGNPNKYFQGHNVFGSGDVETLVLRMTIEILAVLGLESYYGDPVRWVRDGKITRIDLTRSYDLGSVEVVRHWIKGAEPLVRTKFQSARIDRGTLYIGKNSRRKSVKVYAKGDELNRHRPAVGVHSTPALHELANRLLRVEVTLRSMELKERELSYVNQWYGGIADDVFENVMGGVEMNDTLVLPDPVIANMPRKHALIYAAWRQGGDIFSLFCRNTAYKYIREFDQLYGIPLDKVQPRVLNTKWQGPMERPLRSYLNGPGVSVEWCEQLLAS